MDQFNKLSLYKATVQMRSGTKNVTAANGANLDGMDVVVSPLYQINGSDDPNLSAYAGETAMGLRYPVHESVAMLPSGDLVNFQELPWEAREQYPLMAPEVAQHIEGAYIPNAINQNPFANPQPEIASNSDYEY